MAQSLREQIAQFCSILKEEEWHGFNRISFDFQGRTAWIAEPPAGPRADHPWSWVMQWAEAYVERTAVPDLLREGYYHTTIDLFNTRMNDEGIAIAAAYQDFLVQKLNFAPKARLLGMSWGGFFSVRYTAVHPENVSHILLDAPLMNFEGFKSPKEHLGPWANMPPADGNWTTDPRMPVTMGGKIAETHIPLMLIYGGQDQSAVPALNCELFMKDFEAKGGKAIVDYRQWYGHHPHGVELNETHRIVDFYNLAQAASDTKTQPRQDQPRA